MEYNQNIAGRKNPSFLMNSSDFNKVINKAKYLIKEWELKNINKVTIKHDMYTSEGKLRDKRYIEFYGKELFNIVINVYAYFQPDYGYPEDFSSDYTFYDISGARHADKYYHKYTFYVTKKDNIVVHTQFFHEEPIKDCTINTPEDDKTYILYDSASNVKSYSSYNEILTDIHDLPQQYKLELEDFFDSKTKTEIWDI